MVAGRARPALALVCAAILALPVNTDDSVFAEQVGAFVPVAPCEGRDAARPCSLRRGLQAANATEGIAVGEEKAEALTDGEGKEGEEVEATDEEKMEGEEGEKAEGGEEGAEGEKAEGGEEGEDGEEGEEGMSKETVEMVSLAVSLMLLCGVVFVMSLFHIVNHEDPDMRLYAWKVISITLAIFVSVLMFQAMLCVLHEVVLGKYSPLINKLGDVMFLMILFTAMQFMVAWHSYAFQDFPLRRVQEAEASLCSMCDGGRNDQAEALSKQAQKEEIEKQKKQMERRMKCWATLCAHATGFAAITVGGGLQHGHMMDQQPLMSFLCVPVMFIGLVVLSRMFRKVRKGMIARHHDTVHHVEEHRSGVFTENDMKRHKDLDPEAMERKGRSYALQKWDEEVFESENDVCGLCVSFLLVQAVRYNISGIVPDAMGIEEEHWTHPTGDIVKLSCFTLLFAPLTMFFVMLGSGEETGGDESKILSMPLLRRLLLVSGNAAAMAFAWTLLYSFKWIFGSYSHIFGNPNHIVARVALMLVISAIAFTMIYFLDKIADMKFTGDDADRAIESIINALGILVGFSWEQSFDGAVEVIAELTPNPVMVEVGLAILVVIVVVSPWRRYILMKTIELQEEKDERTENKQGEGGESEPLQGPAQ